MNGSEAALHSEDFVPQAIGIPVFVKEFVPQAIRIPGCFGTLKNGPGDQVYANGPKSSRKHPKSDHFPRARRQPPETWFLGSRQGPKTGAARRAARSSQESSQEQPGAARSSQESNQEQPEASFFNKKRQ